MTAIEYVPLRSGQYIASCGAMQATEIRAYRIEAIRDARQLRFLHVMQNATALAVECLPPLVKRELKRVEEIRPVLDAA